MHRIDDHPILKVPRQEEFELFWRGGAIKGRAGETIASALFANGIKIFGHHPKDGAPQGIFCANGQCSQCLVLADGRPVKSCMELAEPGMKVEPADGYPVLPEADQGPGKPVAFREPEKVSTTVLIIGGGPAGLSAAIELGKRSVDVILIDDKHRLGGKLVLQTHKFFGSSEAVYAGTRGIDIAAKLEEELRKYPTVSIWTRSTALAVFSDRKVGILRDGGRYIMVEPRVLLVAAGAREKNLAFPGNTLPGVYGAGAFQTLVNRDLVRPAEKLFIVGGGNVGLIAGYHALQAGISVVGLVEALPECGGYKVHRDKLARLGVPIMTSHTILAAEGREGVESVTIAAVDDRFRPVPGTERTFACDTVLIAVGLDPVAEFYSKAVEFGMTVYAAGDAEEIAEASAAIFSGRIRGLEILRSLGAADVEISPEWYETAEILKSKPGAVCGEKTPSASSGVFPVLHCGQEIPCNPCTTVCPKGLITITGDMRNLPDFRGEGCTGCERCVAICPGLAITLVDHRRNADFPTVSIPFEFPEDMLKAGDTVTVVDTASVRLGEVKVEAVKSIKANNRTVIIKVLAPAAYAARIAGLMVQKEQAACAAPEHQVRTPDDAIICRCERVTAGEIRRLIREGVRDINEIKAVTRACMGACQSKTCTPLIHRLFREEGVPDAEVVDQVKRPLFMEVPIGVLAGLEESGKKDK